MLFSLCKLTIISNTTLSIVQRRGQAHPKSYSLQQDCVFWALHHYNGSHCYELMVNTRFHHFSLSTTPPNPHSLSGLHGHGAQAVWEAHPQHYRKCWVSSSRVHSAQGSQHSRAVQGNRSFQALQFKRGSPTHLQKVVPQTQSFYLALCERCKTGRHKGKARCI